MIYRFSLKLFLMFIVCRTSPAQTIKINELSIGMGYEQNIFGSPKTQKKDKSLIKNDYYNFIKSELEIFKTTDKTKHKINLKTSYYNFSNYKVLNNHAIRLRYFLKYNYSEKIKTDISISYYKNKSFRTNILGEKLRFAYFYQTPAITKQLDYRLNKKIKFSAAYNFAYYFYDNEIKDYNFYKNKLIVETIFNLNDIGTPKKMKISFDILKRNYLSKISRNRVGEKSSENNLWNWTYYNASVEFFEEVDVDRELKLKYEVVFRNDNFEGYYNYTEQNIELNYVYFFDYENSISLNAQVGYRKYKYRITSDNHNLSISYPQVDVQYKHLLNSQLAFHLNLQTYSRNFNLEEVESLTRRNYFSFYVEALLSCNFTKKN